jgi:hypothetical protein
MKAAKRRHRAEMADCADRIVWTLERVGEDDAARAVQRYFLPHTIEGPWTRKSPLAKANERIAELEALVEELLLDDAIWAAITADLSRKGR